MICLQHWPCPEAILKAGRIDLSQAVHAQKHNVIPPEMNALCVYKLMRAGLENNSDNSNWLILNSECPQFHVALGKMQFKCIQPQCRL